jgi:hypothetical protein
MWVTLMPFDAHTGVSPLTLKDIFVNHGELTWFLRRLPHYQQACLLELLFTFESDLILDVCDSAQPFSAKLALTPVDRKECERSEG